MLDNLKDKIDQVMDSEELIKLLLEIQYLDRAQLFEFIWPLAVSEPVDGTPLTANHLLVKLDLPTERSCEDLLSDVRDRYWNVSNKIIPFYLVCRFGKKHVIECAEEMASHLPEGNPKTRVSTVAYWAKMPAESLIEGMHYYEWEEAIEGDQYERPVKPQSPKD